MKKTLDNTKKFLKKTSETLNITKKVNNNPKPSGNILGQFSCVGGVAYIYENMVVSLTDKKETYQCKGYEEAREKIIAMGYQ